MLTGKMVRVRYSRDRVIPTYINVENPSWVEAAQRLRLIFQTREGRSRGEMEQELREGSGTLDNAQMRRGEMHAGYV